MTRITRIKKTIKVTDIPRIGRAIEVTDFPKSKAKVEDRAGRKEYNLRSTAAKRQQKVARLNQQEVSWEDPVKDQDHQVSERIQTDMPIINNVTALHDQKQKRIPDMPKVINAAKLPEKINQPKSTCNLILEKEDSIADGVTDNGNSLSALAEPFCPYMGHSMEENQQKASMGNNQRKWSGGYQRKQQWTEIDASEENQHRKQYLTQESLGLMFGKPQYLILQYYILTPSLSGAMQLTPVYVLGCQ